MRNLSPAAMLTLVTKRWRQVALASQVDVEAITMTHEAALANPGHAIATAMRHRTAMRN